MAPRHAAPLRPRRRGWWVLLAGSLGALVLGAVLAATSVAGPVGALGASPRPTSPPQPVAEPTPVSRPAERADNRPAAPRVAVQDATGVPPAQAADQPIRVTAARIGLDAAVRPVGVDQGGAMALPARPTQLGWYRFGAAPGDATGAAVLAGHVDSRRFGLGPLVRLQQLRAGDGVRVELASGAVLRYRVTDAGAVAKRRLALDVLFRRDGPAALVLVTCGGRYDTATGGYVDNVVVTAVPLGPRP